MYICTLDCIETDIMLLTVHFETPGIFAEVELAGHLERRDHLGSAAEHHSVPQPFPAVGNRIFSRS